MEQKQHFTLRWNTYIKHITSAFERFRRDDDFVDCTLSCEGKKIKIHKMLLSACSPYFHEIFKENPCQHPVIILKGVNYNDLASLVDFMYKGEVSVLQEQLGSFLNTAELLQVSGLTDGIDKAAITSPQSEERASDNNSTSTPIINSNTITSGLLPAKRAQPNKRKSPPLKKMRIAIGTNRTPKSPKARVGQDVLPSTPITPVLPENNTIKDEISDDEGSVKTELVETGIISSDECDYTHIVFADKEEEFVDSVSALCEPTLGMDTSDNPGPSCSSGSSTLKGTENRIDENIKKEFISEEKLAVKNPRSKRKTIDHTTDIYKKPFDEGWKREFVIRNNSSFDQRTGSRFNRGDVYYFAPNGCKLRSLKQVSEFLVNTNTSLTESNFTFCKEPLITDDPEKEVVRLAISKLGSEKAKSTPKQPDTRTTHLP